MELDLSSFEKAVHSLAEALNEYEINTNDFIKDSCFQRFEYTYELAWKTIKRYLETTSANPAEIDRYSFQDLIRTANGKGLLLNNWEVWKRYRQYRGTTSQAYDSVKATEIYKEIPYFLKEVEYLLAQIKNRNL